MTEMLKVTKPMPRNKASNTRSRIMEGNMDKTPKRFNDR